MGIGEGEEEGGKSGVEEIEDEVEEEDGGGGSGCVTGVWVVLGFGFGLGSVGVVSMGSMEGEGEGEAFDRNACLGICLVCLVRPLWRRCFCKGSRDSSELCQVSAVFTFVIFLMSLCWKFR